MRTPWGRRLRAVLASAGAIGLALFAASPAMAASGTPTTPTELFNAYQNCSTDASAPVWVIGRGLLIEAVPGDTDTTDNDQLTAQFQLWPVADPTQVTSYSQSFVPAGNEGDVTVPSTDLTDGQTYAWQAQTAVGGQTSDWSAPCYITVDDTAPAAVPTVASPNYPQGRQNPGGTPVQFTFGANGVSDVAGYVFSWYGTLPVPVTAIGPHGIPQPASPYDTDPQNFVRADALGGSATVSLVPPGGEGQFTLTVASLDQAMNESAQTTYTFQVAPTAPTVTADGTQQFGEPTTFTFTPNAALQAASPVVSYTVQTEGGQPDQTVTVDAAADGTGTTTLTLNAPSGELLRVTSTSADGWVSDIQWWSSDYPDTTPTVASDVYVENGSSGGAGVCGTFTFTDPNVSNVAGYTYVMNTDDPVTVTAHDGKAVIHWTPDASGWYDLQVYATTTTGAQTSQYYYIFTVN